MNKIQLTTKKTFDAVQFMREQRWKLSEKFSTTTKAEIVAYSGRKNWKIQQSPVYNNGTIINSL